MTVPNFCVEAVIFSFMYFTMLSADLTLCFRFTVFSFLSGVVSHCSFTCLCVLISLEGDAFSSLTVFVQCVQDTSWLGSGCGTLMILQLHCNCDH